MKKIILSVFTVVTLAATTAFAFNPPGINKAVEESFRKEFAGSQLLSWSEQGEYLKATFILAGYRTEAYFTEDGTLHGSIRGLFYNQLPLVVITTIEKRFDAPEVIDVSEITNAGGTIYRLTLDADGKRYRVRTDSNGNLSDVEKLKK